MATFTELVREVVKNIPKGSVLSYRQVAEMCGNKKAARAVANLMASNYNEDIPCHRVIRSTGSVGGYNRGGEEAKRALLETEGAVI